MRPATPLVVTLAATLPTWCFAWHALAVPTTPAIRALPTAVRMVALAADPAAAAEEEVVPLLSGLNGKALKQYDVPSKSEVRRAVPDHCFKRDTRRSLGHLLQSSWMTAACVAAGRLLIPFTRAALPLWIAYAAVTGTVAMGLWVLAHECGHGAFSDNRRLQDTVGFILHSALLVPYFSWQRSHAVHHQHTNHIYKGETHVPTVVGGVAGESTPGGEEQMDLAKRMGKRWHGFYQTFGHLTIGWPTYLLAGLTGGSRWVDEHGRPPNHFWPSKPFSSELWPGRWASKVVQSTAGVGAALAFLGLWARSSGWGVVMALYGGPYLVVNMWLILYTWLQHTDVDVPHLHDKEFTYMRGAFLTIDRPYPPLIDWLHHRIGTTHVAHHIDCTIPHYHGREATDAIAKTFPDAYLYEPTPIHMALWRVACNCIAVKRRSASDARLVFVPLASW